VARSTHAGRRRRSELLWYLLPRFEILTSKSLLMDFITLNWIWVRISQISQVHLFHNSQLLILFSRRWHSKYEKFVPPSVRIFANFRHIFPLLSTADATSNTNFNFGFRLIRYKWVASKNKNVQAMVVLIVYS
jgi:hypothetical protein